MIDRTMNPILIEPHDTFFFRDSIPMSAGQGRGAGARLPLPSTLHEAFRASLLDVYGRSGETAAFRPSNAPRSGGWLGKGKSVVSHGSKDFQSLRIVGPFPFLAPDSDKNDHPSGVLFPLPLDLIFDEGGNAHTLSLRPLDPSMHSGDLPALAVSPVPARKDQVSGFLTAADMSAYLANDLSTLKSVVTWKELFEEEYRIGVELSPESNSAVQGQLYAATHARPSERFRILAWAGLKSPINDEEEKLAKLSALTLGGERRMARLVRDAIAPVPVVPALPAIPDLPGPVVIKWTLATSAVFANGWLPGWCKDTTPQARPEGRVCLPLKQGRAQLIATCLGKPVAFAGWDMVKAESKPTQLAVPAGSVYYFLCENAATASELAALLHWRPRSDSYGEKGFGYGFACSQPTSSDVLNLASTVFNA
jgi:CRISPR-associated protein Cmr3